MADHPKIRENNLKYENAFSFVSRLGLASSASNDLSNSSCYYYYDYLSLNL